VDYDVIIAGAGPAGVAVAARLHQHDTRCRAVVLERYGFPRPKPCGGGLTGHAGQVMAELDLRLDVPHCSSREARVRFGSFVRDIALASPVNIIRREEFDHSLVRQVRQKGVEIVEGEGVKDIALGPDAVTVRTSRGRVLRARVLVGADGAASVVRKYLLDNEKALPHRLFKMEMEAPARGSVLGAGDGAMLYDFTPLLYGLRGYLWVFPVPGDRLNVGVMHYPAYRRGGPALIDILRRGLAELEIELPERGVRGWPVWGYEPGKAISGPRVLVVGDAAGIDALTGEGIAVAMEHAVIAGDAVHQAMRSGDMSFADYGTRVRRAVVGRELSLDRSLARMLYGGKGERWRFWLPLVLFDRDMLDMYAARVCGSEILADQWLRLSRAMARHLALFPSRRRALRACVTPWPR
jgi:geranylgeranyl reductase family protein